MGKKSIAIPKGAAPRAVRRDRQRLVCAHQRMLRGHVRNQRAVDNEMRRLLTHIQPFAKLTAQMPQPDRIRQLPYGIVRTIIKNQRRAQAKRWTGGALS